MGLTPEILQMIREEHRTAPHSHKTVVLDKWVDVLRGENSGITRQTLYRRLGPKRKREGKPTNPLWMDWAKTIAAVKRRPPEEAGELPTKQARDIATSGDAPLLPAEAANVPVGTYDRLMREMGYSKRSVRANRFQAAAPNQAHHIDASSSAFFFVHRRMPDGTYVLRLFRPAANYKNKPVPCDKLRWWYYGMVDDHSGVKFSKGVATHGENGRDGMEFCVWAWERLGVCKKLLGDEGSLKKGLASSGFIEKCGVDFPPMTPYEKRAHGKIEITWRRMWQSFELQFFAVDNWQKYEITDVELNRRLLIFNEEENQRKHRFEKRITRMDAWRRVMLHGGLVKLPDDVLARAANCYRRKVDICGMFSIPGWPVMEALGIHDAWVFVYEAVFEDKLVVKEIATGNVFPVREFKPLDENEFRGHEETVHQLAVKAAPLLRIDESALLFQRRQESGAGSQEKSNIISLPIREVVREIPNVFDVKHFASIDDAMNEFDGLYLSAADRAAIEGVVQEHDMDKAFVRELAQEIRGELEVCRANAI